MTDSDYTRAYLNETHTRTRTHAQKELRQSDTSTERHKHSQEHTYTDSYMEIYSMQPLMTFSSVVDGIKQLQSHEMAQRITL